MEISFLLTWLLICVMTFTIPFYSVLICFFKIIICILHLRICILFFFIFLKYSWPKCLSLTEQLHRTCLNIHLPTVFFKKIDFLPKFYLYKFFHQSSSVFFYNFMYVSCDLLGFCLKDLTLRFLSYKYIFDHFLKLIKTWVCQCSYSINEHHLLLFLFYNSQRNSNLT